MICPGCNKETQRTITRYVDGVMVETCRDCVGYVPGDPREAPQAVPRRRTRKATFAIRERAQGEHGPMATSKATAKLLAGAQKAPDGSIVDAKGRRLDKVYGGDAYDKVRRRKQAHFVETKRPTRQQQADEYKAKILQQRHAEWREAFGTACPETGAQ